MRQAIRACVLWLTFSLTIAPFALLTMAAMVGTAGVVAITLCGQYGPIAGLVLTATGLVTSYAVALVAHEAGHILGGGLVGWRARSVRVGPLAWTFSSGRWRLAWCRRGSWLTGNVETAFGPPDAWRLAVFLLAGPGANFALAAAAGGIAATPIPSPPRCLAGLLALISACLGAWSLVPLRERGQASDGLNLWRLLAHGALPLTSRKKNIFGPVAPIDPTRLTYERG